MTGIPQKQLIAVYHKYTQTTQSLYLLQSGYDELQRGFNGSILINGIPTYIHSTAKCSGQFHHMSTTFNHACS